MARVQPVLSPAELAALEGKGNRLSAEELGFLAKQLTLASDANEAARIKERLTHGFYVSKSLRVKDS